MLPGVGIVPAQNSSVYDSAIVTVHVKTTEVPPRGVALGFSHNAGYRSTPHAHTSNGSKSAMASCMAMQWVVKERSQS